MMKITEIEHMTKHRVRVFLDGEPAFVIRDRDAREWQLEEEAELDGEHFEELMGYIERMAVREAMELLLRRDYSEAELMQKLVGKGFNTDMAGKGVAYVKSYHYVDDERYASQLIAGRKGTVSRRMMIFKLRQKGIPDDVIRTAMEAAEWDDMEGIRYELRRKCREDTELCEFSEKERQKLCQSLVRKGYHYSDIRCVFTDGG